MILNLTQHQATEEQRTAGVVDLPAEFLPHLRDALTFHALPQPENVAYRARLVVKIAHEAAQAMGATLTQAMIGGAGYLMGPLERDLAAADIEPLHAFARREVVETAGLDGAAVKTGIRSSVLKRVFGCCHLLSQKSVEKVLCPSCLMSASCVH